MTFKDENELQHKLGNYLKKWFLIKYEVWSIDMKKRIDIVATHKENTDYSFGIEVKLNDKKKGSSIAKWLKQASEYAQKEFKGYGKLIILCYPRISEYYLKEGLEMNQHGITDVGHNVNTLLGQFGIGEIQKNHDNKIRIIYSGSVLWTEKNNDLRINNIKKVVK